MFLLLAVLITAIPLINTPKIAIINIPNPFMFDGFKILNIELYITNPEPANKIQLVINADITEYLLYPYVYFPLILGISPISVLIRVDFPTFVLPIIDTKPDLKFAFILSPLFFRNKI